MSGFIFDAKAARAAIAARGPNVAAAAVLAVEGGAMARKPQKPHGKPFRIAIAQPQQPQQPQEASIPTGAAPADEIEERVALAADCVPAVYFISGSISAFRARIDLAFVEGVGARPGKSLVTYTYNQRASGV